VSQCTLQSVTSQMETGWHAVQFKELIWIVNLF